MASEWLTTSWAEAGLVVLSTLAIYVALIIVVRVNGLRSFSKMSGFDFATTSATGALVATVAATSTSLANGALALVTMIGAQTLIARSRFHPRLANVVDNQPILLMTRGEFVQDGLDQTRITEYDIIASCVCTASPASKTWPPSSSRSPGTSRCCAAPTASRTWTRACPRTSGTPTGSTPARAAESCAGSCAAAGRDTQPPDR